MSVRQHYSIIKGFTRMVYQNHSLSEPLKLRVSKNGGCHKCGAGVILNVCCENSNYSPRFYNVNHLGFHNHMLL